MRVLFVSAILVLADQISKAIVVRTMSLYESIPIVQNFFHFTYITNDGMAFGIENGAPLEGNLENIKFFADLGVNYITLAHSKSNHISDSSYDENKRWPDGLSPFGFKVVKEMNKQGVMIDISHVSDAAFMKVLELSKAPVVALSLIHI